MNHTPSFNSEEPLADFKLVTAGWSVITASPWVPTRHQVLYICSLSFQYIPLVKVSVGAHFTGENPKAQRRWAVSWHHMGSGVPLPEFKSWLPYWVAVWPRASYLISIFVTPLYNKTMIGLISQDYTRIQWISTCQVLRTVPTTWSELSKGELLLLLQSLSFFH